MMAQERRNPDELEGDKPDPVRHRDERPEPAPGPQDPGLNFGSRSLSASAPSSPSLSSAAAALAPPSVPISLPVSAPVPAPALVPTPVPTPTPTPTATPPQATEGEPAIPARPKPSPSPPASPKGGNRTPAFAPPAHLAGSGENDSHFEASADIAPIGFQIAYIEPGQTLFGKYEVIRKIGEGGMGAVWLVRHLELECERALKTIASNIAAKDEARQRFRREAKAMASFSHPNAVTIHDFRLAADLAYIDMEYVRGESLERLLRPGVPMPESWISRVVEQLCDVLQEAHEKRIVHRDLKPSNLMMLTGRMPGREHLKVLDFGIAKIMEEAELSLTNNVFLGTAAYASPEQANGDSVDDRSDLYSVGVLIYQFLTGHRPFTGPVIKQVYDLVNTAPPPLTMRNPGVRVSPEVEQVVLSCLAKSPDQRPSSAKNLAEEFLNALRGWSASSFPGIPPFPNSGDPSASSNFSQSPILDASGSPVRISGERSTTRPLGPSAFAQSPTEGSPASDPGPRARQGAGAAPSSDAEQDPDHPESSKMIFGGVEVEVGVEKALTYGEKVIGGAASKFPTLPPPNRDEVARFQIEGILLNVRFAPGGARVVAGCRNDMVQVFDLEQRRMIRALPIPGPVSSLLFTADCRKVLCGCKDAIRIINIDSCLEMNRFEQHREWVGGMCLTANGARALSGGGDLAVRLWDVRSGRQLQILRGHRSGIWSVAFHRDEKFAISGGEDHTLRVWDLDSGDEVHCLAAHNDWVSAVISVPGGDMAISAGMDDVLKVWDLTAVKMLRILEGHTQGVICAAISREGRWLLSGSKDATIRLWDIQTGKEHHCFEGHVDWVTTVAWSPNEQHFASGGRDGTVRVWRIPPELLSGAAPPEEERWRNRSHAFALPDADEDRSSSRRFSFSRFFGGKNPG